MSSFYVCKCGFPADNHEFKHKYENKVKVGKKTQVITRTLTEFTLDAHDYPQETKTKCSYPNCSLLLSLHTNQVYNAGTPEEVKQHPYTPVDVKYRQINFTIPLKTECNRLDCGVSLEKHSKVQTHLFTTKVIIKNKEENDVVVLQHPDDEDVKINLCC